MSNLISKIPNFLTLMRMVGTVFMIFYYYFPSPFKFEVLWVVFALCGISDYFDGYISRKFNATSNLGRCLDPISDKLLLITSLFILVHAGLLNIVIAFVFMTREILISGLREFLSLERISLPVSRLAKWKTALQLLGVGMCFFSVSGALIGFYMETIGSFALLYPITFVIENILILTKVVLWVAVYTSIHTGLVYIYQSRAYLK